MDTNSSNTSIIISLDSDDATSDSDSTDYEPQQKKCKLENGTEVGEVSLVEGTMTIPIRAATSVSEVNFSREAPPLCSEGVGGSMNFGETCSTSSANVAMGSETQNLLTVGDLVEQTLQATLDRPPHPQASMAQSLFSFDEPIVEPERPHVPRLSATDNTPSNSLAVNNAPSGDVPTTAEAGEDVVRTNSAGLVSLGLERRRQNPLERLLTEQNANNANHSSNSSSEYFTDDMDPMEIPSDEYISPPYSYIRRRISIILRRNPPPSELVQNGDDRYYHNELEVASGLDINENPIEDGSSTSGVDDEVVRRARSPVAVEPVVPPEQTDNNFADNENVKSDGDSECTQPPTNDSNKGQTVSRSEISEKDKKKLLCSQCQGPKAEPYFRYCLRCFKIRRAWLPSRPASRRLKSRKTQQLRNNNSNSLNNSRTTRSPDTSEGEGVVVVATPGSQQAPAAASPSAAAGDNNIVRPCSSTRIQQSLPSIQPVDMNEGFLINDNNPTFNRLSANSQPANLTPMELFATPECNSGPPIRQAVTSQSQSQPGPSSSQSQSQSGPSSSQSQASLYSVNSQSTQSSYSSSQPLQTSPSSPKNRNNDFVPAVLSSQCSICYVREKDAAFVHKKSAHLYCCYTCADKILKKNGKCPICRERILRVVKIVSV